MFDGSGCDMEAVESDYAELSPFCCMLGGCAGFWGLAFSGLLQNMRFLGAQHFLVFRVTRDKLLYLLVQIILCRGNSFGESF